MSRHAVGDLVDGRYKLERALGGTATMPVFVATDLALRRTVAIRVADAAGADALRRQAAVLRSLQFDTAHVVPVLDEGETPEGDAYLVTTLIEGTDVEHLVAQRGPLPAADVASIGVQLLDATLTARRVDSGLGTLPASAVLGRDRSVRVTRFRPEPERSSGAGDVACVEAGRLMHELLTGAQPQPGRTVAGYGVTVPPEMARIVDDAVDGRIAEATAMRERLAEIARTLSAPVTPLPPTEPPRRWHMWVAIGALVLAAAAIVAIVLVFVRMGDESDTVQVPDVTGMSVQQATQRLSDAGLRAVVDGSADDSDAVVVSTDPSPGSEVDDDSEVTLTLGAGEASVPDVVGDAEGNARSALVDAGLVVEVENAPSSDVPSGVVSAQQPGGGTRVDAGTRVTITVSSGVPVSTVPSLVGLSLDDAVSALQGADLELGEVTDAEGAPANQVLSQDPAAGAEVDPGTSVDVTVATGPGTTTSSTTPEP